MSRAIDPLRAIPLRQRLAWRVSTWTSWIYPLICRIYGHRLIASVDYNEGFDIVWCRRCGEALRG
jgi:hypothetical protein